MYVDDSKIISSGSLFLTGIGGDGGQHISGMYLWFSEFSSAGDTIITGTAGEGDVVNNGQGIVFDVVSLTVDSADEIKIKGTGSGVGLDKENQNKVVNRLTSGEGIYLYDSLITSLNSSAPVEFIGRGGESEDQINSKDNTGIKIIDSIINSENGGGPQFYTGQGGIGGELNSGLLIDNSTIKANAGNLSFTGVGGSGINIKESLGVSVYNSTFDGASIVFDGTGGESVLKKDSFDVFGNDTFNQTADNIGVRIDLSTIASNSSNLSITGAGGTLTVDGIINPDRDNEIDAISVASSLEGVTLSNISSSSPGATYISGQAGKPIAGDKNRGTTIINSTFQMATALPASERNAFAQSVDNRIEGNAYSGTNDNYGLSIDSTDIESTNQDLTLAGRGGLKATGEKNYGIYIGNQSSVKVGKDGNSKLLNIYGAGGDGTDMTGGILTENTSYTVDGTINMHGESQGADKFGNNSVEIFNGVNISSSDDSNISGSNNVNISDADISSGNDTNITAENDINLADSTVDSGNNTNLDADNNINLAGSTINSGNNTNLNADNNINLADSTINSGKDTNLNAGNNIDIVGSTINSGNNTNLKAGESINIEESSLSAGNTINLQATNITTVAVELNSQELSIQSNNFTSNNRNQTDSNIDGDSLSLNLISEQQSESKNYSDEQLTMRLSGNVNYFSEPSPSNSSEQSNDSSGRENNTEANTSDQTSDQSIGSSTALTSEEIQQRHNQSEEQSATFVAEQLGLKRQPALSVQAIQQMLTNGELMMNSARQ
ncbi:MAG: hypothetical protein CMN91_04965 [Synechococcus sp. ARS1019]|nr:hypothetical protein [Synechococcus sp. ARS1019]